MRGTIGETRQASLVMVEYRGLARLGLGYLETFLPAFGARVVVMEHPLNDDQQELVEDLIAIILLGVQIFRFSGWGGSHPRAGESCGLREESREPTEIIVGLSNHFEATPEKKVAADRR